MNLGKLLGVGRSVFAGDTVVSYHLNRGGLPRFNEGRNPFAPKPAETAPVVPSPEKADSATPAPASTPKAPSPFALKPAGKVAANAAVPPAPKVSRPGWTTRLNPFRPSAPVSAAAPAPKAEQVEFSLGAVKVVHNDLADADVEIVPARSNGGAPAAVLPSARRNWQYLGEDLAKSSRI